MNEPSVPPPGQPGPSGESADPTAASVPQSDKAGTHSYEGTGIIWAVVAGLLVATALVVLIAQNTEPVPVHFLWITVDVSLVVLILATAILTVCLSELVGLVWRRRRRELLKSRAALDEPTSDE